MKKTLKTGKKALSVFMAALMVLTAWVFLAPEKADAATAGSYKIKVVVTCTNGFNNKNTKWNLTYRANNGTGGTTTASGDISDKDGMFDTGFWGTSGNVVTTLFESYYSGFPTYFEIKGKKSTLTGDGKFRVDVYVNGTWVAGQYTSFSGNVNFTCGATTAGGYYPYVNKVDWSLISTAAETVNVPNNDATAAVTKKLNTSATAYDQYGVEWYQEPYYSLHESSDKQTAEGKPISGVTLSPSGQADSTTLNVTKDAQEWVAGGTTKGQRDVYVNAYLSDKASSVKRITLVNPKYNVSFKFTDKDGNTTTENQTLYYGESPTTQLGKVPQPDETYHYAFSGWSPKVQKVTGDAAYTGKITSEEHKWTETGRTEPTCQHEGGVNEECTVCEKTRDTKLDKVGHDFIFGYEVKKTCTTDGYKIYKCSYDGCTVTEKRDVKTATGHVWELIKTDEAGCESEGKEYYSCTVCGEKKEEPLAAIGHDYVAIFEKEPTCTESGWASYKCSHCGVYDSKRGGEDGTEVGPLGHSWGEWKNVEGNAPTCTKGGTQERFCLRCKAARDTQNVPPTDHEFDRENKYTVLPTCTEEGYSYYKCKHINNGVPCEEIEKIDIVPANGHDLKNATWKTTTEAKCGIKGEEQLFCPVCKKSIDKREIPALEHEWGAYAKTKEATCTENEKQTAECQRPGCKVTNTVDIPGTAKGHKFENYVYQSNATCTADGTEKAQCENYNLNSDGESVRCTETDIRPATGTVLGHDFSKLIGTLSEATCTKNRVDIYQCSRCEEKTNSEAEGTVLGHDYGNWTHDEGSETCAKYGTKHGSCLRKGCGKTVENVEDRDYGLAKHIYETENGELVYRYVTGSETCTADGKERAYCINYTIHDNDENWNCKKYKERTAKGTMHPHTYPDPAENRDAYISNGDGTCLENGTMYALCTECKIAKQTVTEPDSRKPHFVANWISDNNATCTEDGTKHGYCVYGCGKEFKDVEDVGSALGHWFRDYKVTTEATCTGDRVRTATCERCDETESVTDIGSALGHKWSDWEFVEGKEADCTKGGTVTRHCERGCVNEKGEPLSETKTVEPTAHSWSWTVIEKTAEDGSALPADCTRGYQKHLVCSVCDAEKENSTVDVPGGAHHFVLDEKTFKEATCTEEGYRRVICDVCGCVESTVTTPKTGHLNTALDEKTVVAATCKEKGYSGDIICTLCKEVVKEGYATDVTTNHIFTNYTTKTKATCTANATEKAICDVCGIAENTREVPGSALGHSFTSFAADENSATCTKDGTKTAECDRDGCDAKKTVRDPGSALGHKWGEWVTVKAPTCEEAGSAKRSCERVGCKLEVEKQLRKLSHTPSEWIIDEEATCTKAGKRHKECVGGCGYIFEEEIVEPLEHKFTVETVGVTCIDDGYSVYTCSVCKTKKQGGVVKALGHDWSGEWVVTKAPTCTKKGSETLTCTRCDKTQTRTIDALGHNEVIDPAVPATCTEDGLSEGSHCDRCGEVLKEQEVVTKPHRDADEDGKCDECGKEIKHSTDLGCGCICHKEFWLMRFMYKVLRVLWKLFGIGKSCSCGATHY